MATKVPPKKIAKRAKPKPNLPTGKRQVTGTGYGTAANASLDRPKKKKSRGATTGVIG